LRSGCTAAEAVAELECVAAGCVVCLDDEIELGSGPGLYITRGAATAEVSQFRGVIDQFDGTDCVIDSLSRGVRGRVIHFSSQKTLNEGIVGDFNIGGERLSRDDCRKPKEAE